MAKAQAEIKGADGLFLAGFKAGTDFLVDYLASNMDELAKSDVAPFRELYHAVCLDVLGRLGSVAIDENQRLIELALQGEPPKTAQN